MSDSNGSSIRMNPSLEEKINSAATAAEVTELLHQAAVDQGLVRPDVYDPNILIPTEVGTNPQRYAKALTVEGGKKLFFEGDTELEVEQRITTFLKDQLKHHPTRRETAAAEAAAVARTQQQTEQARDVSGRFVSQEDADRAAQEEIVRRADLELRFKRGDLSTSDYLVETGAIEKHLQENLGISVEDLQLVAQQQQTERFAQGWEQATNEFLASPEGRKWPGGEENMRLVGKLIEDNGLVDESDKVDVLKRVCEYAVEHELLTENPDTEYAKEISEARSSDEVAQVNRKYFGRSSGGGGFFGGR